MCSVLSSFNSRDAGLALTPQALLQAVAERRQQKPRLMQQLNKLVQDKIGVPNYAHLLDVWMPPKLQPILCFNRQVATASIENVMAEELGRWLSQSLPCQVETVTMTRDTWGSNAYKKSLTGIPFIKKVSGSTVATRVQKVVPKQQRTDSWLHLRAFDSIPAAINLKQWDLQVDGTVIDVHNAMRQQAGLIGGTNFDVSYLWELCVRLAQKPLESVYVEADDGKTQRVPSFQPDDQRYIRPNAAWNYLMDMAMYVTGDRIMLATTIEEDDQEVQEWFLTNMALIEEATGYLPLVIWLPHYPPYQRTDGSNVDMNEVNPAVFAPGWRDSVPIPEASVSPYRAAELLTASLIEL